MVATGFPEQPVSVGFYRPQQPTKFELVINLKVSEVAWSLNHQRSLPARDKVIE